MANGRIIVPEIRNTDDLRRFCENVRAEAAAAADMYGNLAASLAKRWGTLPIPGQGRFSGSPAKRTVRHLIYMADCAEGVARGSKQLWVAYQRNIYEPIHSASAAEFKV
jgi:hypothetical protein